MKKIRILIIGAGSAGTMIASEFKHNTKIKDRYEIVGFLDDNPEITSVIEVPVLGRIQEAVSIIRKYNVSEIVIAIPSASHDIITNIMSIVYECHVPIKVVPGIWEIVTGNVQFSQLKLFDPVDLLGREEVSFELSEISQYYSDKVIFVTGAGGSIGSEIVVQLLNLPVKQIIIFGRGENSIYTLMNSLKENQKIKFVIGDIKDEKKINHEIASHAPDIIFHAAAHKHVPLMEAYPDESLKNNVLGTYRAAMAAICNKVSRFIFVSTDKAVNPTSVMGSSKRMAERVILSLDKQAHATKFSITRFGNVLGSRGSVVPLFKSQIERGGPITITHPEVTRFFMSIREAARLVIKSGMIEKGKIFVLDMGRPIKIIDLAKNMIKWYSKNDESIPIIFTGLRKGEKLYEEILTESENLSKTKYEKLFISHEDRNILKKDELSQMIDDIDSAVVSFNKSKMIKIIKKYVPEYKEWNGNSYE